MSDVWKRILAACIDRKEFKKDPDVYLHENEALATGCEILTTFKLVEAALQLHEGWDN